MKLLLNLSLVVLLLLVQRQLRAQIDCAPPVILEFDPRTHYGSQITDTDMWSDHHESADSYNWNQSITYYATLQTNGTKTGGFLSCDIAAHEDTREGTGIYPHTARISLPILVWVRGPAGTRYDLDYTAAGDYNLFAPEGCALGGPYQLLSFRSASPSINFQGCFSTAISGPITGSIIVTNGQTSSITRSFADHPGVVYSRAMAVDIGMICGQYDFWTPEINRSVVDASAHVELEVFRRSTLPPQCDFTPSTQCIGVDAPFDGIAIDPDVSCENGVNIIDWMWTFETQNELDTRTGQHVTYSWSQEGTYDVTLHVTDGSGAVAYSTRQVTVCRPKTLIVLGRSEFDHLAHAEIARMQLSSTGWDVETLLEESHDAVTSALSDPCVLGFIFLGHGLDEDCINTAFVLADGTNDYLRPEDVETATNGREFCFMSYSSCCQERSLWAQAFHTAHLIEPQRTVPRWVRFPFNVCTCPGRELSIPPFELYDAQVHWRYQISPCCGTLLSNSENSSVKLQISMSNYGRRPPVLFPITDYDSQCESFDVCTTSGVCSSNLFPVRACAQKYEVPANSQVLLSPPENEFQIAAHIDVSDSVFVGAYLFETPVDPEVVGDIAPVALTLVFSLSTTDEIQGEIGYDIVLRYNDSDLIDANVLESSLRIAYGNSESEQPTILVPIIDAQNNTASFSVTEAGVASLVAVRANYYVDCNSPPGGNGSQGSPYQSIDQALAVAPDGSMIIMAAGSYPSPLSPIDRPMFVVSQNGTATIGN